MSPPRNKGKALAAIVENAAWSPRFRCQALLPNHNISQANELIVTAQGAGKKLTRGKRLSKEQSAKIQKERLERLQKNQKRRADRKIIRMLKKLSINPEAEKKRKEAIKQRNEKRVRKKMEMNLDLKQENAADQHK
ncbi:hypothetical protein BCIN_09g00640 [Botrytis cinerea B05.10]|uniref:Uncharacterized protein n=1 Tax=Botryotinia fuckeliana (strain B05.10) TaxID=332648 RepID=A0A384JRQ6_BOTFB|nr:hypothetical protein BCIN_09g00640 [Botrytis cinerea B05.10]ATZ53182.1 hypothetical protein BCIN_09g00640 [Botrytis cinerea B05.10]